MAQDSTSKAEDRFEVQPLDTQSGSLYVPDQPIPDEPPEFSIGKVLKLFRERSFSEVIKDEAWGPHVHLVLILFIVFVIAIVIGIIQLAVG